MDVATIRLLATAKITVVMAGSIMVAACLSAVDFKSIKPMEVSPTIMGASGNLLM
jgi:capsular polysaccharide biosynthesis protein